MILPTPLKIKKHQEEPPLSIYLSFAARAEMPKTKQKEKKKQDVSSESQSQGEVKKKKQHKKASIDRMNGYLVKILKDINPDTGISRNATNIMNGMVVSFLEDVSTRASELTARSGRTTINPKVIRAAIKLVIPNANLSGRMIDAAQAASDTYEASVLND